MHRTPLDVVPDAAHCVIPQMLAARVAAHPDTVFVRFADGGEWTCRQLSDQVGRVARGLHRRGVRQGDHVLSALPNGAEALLTWFAVNTLGAVLVPVNPALKGMVLEHAINLAPARLLVAHETILPALDGLRCPHLAHIVLIGEPGAAAAGWTAEAFDTLLFDDGPAMLPAIDIQPWDAATIIFTSGTTGPAKGVPCTYAQYYSNWDGWAWFDDTDRTLITLPMFHLGGTGPIFMALMSNGSIAFQSRFDTASFWQDVAESGATFAILLGVMATYLLKAPPAPSDRTHGLKWAAVVPLVDDIAAFADRFGCDVFTWFSMTEVCVPLLSPINPSDSRSCGRLRAGCEARIVDAHDCTVAPGSVGELILRCDRPWGFNAGYCNDPKATAEAWRNGWFHTGDAFRCDDRGNFYFIDRLRDSIRRRGENISSAMVEAELLAYPDVLEAAAIGVTSPDGDQDVMAVIALCEGANPDWPALVEFLVPRMPYYMIPRYFRLVDSLPKTPSQKVQKPRLREEGVTADSWDREAAGMVIKRGR